MFEQEFCSYKGCDEWITYGCFCLLMEPAPPCSQVPLLCCRLVKVALKEPVFRNRQCHHSTYIYSLLMPCILTRVNASWVLDLAFLFIFFQGWNLDVVAVLSSNKTFSRIVSFSMSGPVLSGKWLLVLKWCLERDKKGLLKCLCVFREF